MAGSITQADRDFVEEWEHVSPQQWGIIRLDPRGDERPEVIGGRRHFKLTTAERIITEDKCRDEKLNPFKNGSFRPVEVPESVTVTTNPNARSDDELEGILASSDVAFGEWMKVITSPDTLRRMVDLAEAGGSVNLSRFRFLEQRLQETRESNRIQYRDPILANFTSGKPGGDGDGNTVSSGAGNPRRRSVGGGMSSDYRDN